MSFADPMSITINSVAQSMPRNGTGVNLGLYRQADGTNDVKVSHSYGRRYRTEFRLNDTKIASDPFDTTRNEQVSASVYLVVDRPPQGYSVADLEDLAEGLMTFLTASTNANLLKLLGGEI